MLWDKQTQRMQSPNSEKFQKALSGGGVWNHWGNPYQKEKKKTGWRMQSRVSEMFLLPSKWACYKYGKYVHNSHK